MNEIICSITSAIEEGRFAAYKNEFFEKYNQNP